MYLINDGEFCEKVKISLKILAIQIAKNRSLSLKMTISTNNHQNREKVSEICD